MSFTEFLASAANSISTLPPSRLAAGLAGAAGLLLAFLLLPEANADAPAGSRQTITWFGALIAAFLASQLAAYGMRLVEGRANWLELSPAWKAAIILILALLSAAFVLVIMILVS